MTEPAELDLVGLVRLSCLGSFPRLRKIVVTSGINANITQGEGSHMHSSIFNHKAV